MDKLIYYRGQELITPEDHARLRRLFGDTPYNNVVYLPLDENTGTGIHKVTEIMFTIWNNEELNERSDALIERISKGLTYSRAYGRNTVEEGILLKLITEAIIEFNKLVSEEDRIKWTRYPLEFLRLYKIPYKGIVDEMDKEEAKIGEVPEPAKIIEYTPHFEMEQDQCSTYKRYYIKGHISMFNERHMHLYKIFPYLGKLHDCRGYVQLYVYDYRDRDWAMQNVLNYLVENNLIHLEK